MPGETRAIVIADPPETELTLPGLGRVTVQARSLDYEMSWQVRRPLAVNYRAFANAAIAKAMEPHVPLAVIDGLSAAARQKLMLAVLRLRGVERDWESLYGSSLSLDERFFAVTLWSWTEDRRRLIRRLRERQRQLAEDASRGVDPILRSDRDAAMLGRPSMPGLDLPRSVANLCLLAVGSELWLERPDLERINAAINAGKALVALVAFEAPP